MTQLARGLQQLGAKVHFLKRDGLAPLQVEGPIGPGRVEISGEDSQPVSALLIAAAFMEGSTDIYVKNPGEKPWVDLTLSWLKYLGVEVDNNGYTHFRVQGRRLHKGFKYKVPGDFSSAAFPIAAALVTKSTLIIENLDFDDPQGDKHLIDVFMKMGANIERDAKNKRVKVLPTEKLRGIHIDVNPFIDSLTLLAVIGCLAEGETVIVNGAIARSKECNRVACIAYELKKMGADIEEHADGLRIRQSSLAGAPVLSYGDHRMAMSLAVAGLAASGKTHISSTECIKKSYPDFIKNFQQIGANFS
jgi:3-phosphoshikimate 1-carboxyvinyltransferase